MNKKKEKILIFTTGLAGRAIYRNLRNKDFDIIGFIDNNNADTIYDGKNVFSFDNINSLDYDKIAFGGIWSNDIKKQVLKAKIDIKKLWIFRDDEISFLSEKRSIETDKLVKYLSELLHKLNIKYIIDGSSLLSLFRKNDLAIVSDVDFVLINKNEIDILYKSIKNDKLFEKYNVTIVKQRYNSLVSRENETEKIVITSKNKSYEYESIIIDINIFHSYKNHYLLSFCDDYFIFKKELLEKERKIKYKDFYLNIPFKAEEYLTCVYGKSWIKPSKNWSKNDYKNLIKEEEIKNIKGI